MTNPGVLCLLGALWLDSVSKTPFSGFRGPSALLQPRKPLNQQGAPASPRMLSSGAHRLRKLPVTMNVLLTKDSPLRDPGLSLRCLTQLQDQGCMQTFALICKMIHIIREKS